MGLVESGKLPKSLTTLLNLSRKYSLWMYQWGLACCAIEMGSAMGSPRYDVMRLGVIPLPASPRQADLLCVSGTVTDKMAPAVLRLYEQRHAPLNIRMSLPSLDGIKRAVEMGLGVALLPRRCAQGEIARGQLAEIRVPELRSPRQLRFVYRRAGDRSHAARAFLAVARAAARAHA